jgi:hypothetical protein
MSLGTGDKKVEKSYLASAVDSINPWAGSRSATPTPKDPQSSQQPPVNPADHIINPLYGRSFRRYPPDCPRLNVQWFHAVDVSIDLAYDVLISDSAVDSEEEAQVSKGQADYRRRR